MFAVLRLRTDERSVVRNCDRQRFTQTWVKQSETQVGITVNIWFPSKLPTQALTYNAMSKIPKLLTKYKEACITDQRKPTSCWHRVLADESHNQAQISVFTTEIYSKNSNGHFLSNIIHTCPCDLNFSSGFLDRKEAGLTLAKPLGFKRNVLLRRFLASLT